MLGSTRKNNTITEQEGAKMSTKLFDSEMKVMKVVWEKGDISAKQISVILGEQIGWHMNTTYTIIKRLIDKGVIERKEPGFICHPLISIEEVRADEVGQLVDNLFCGSPETLFATLLNSKAMSKNQLEKLRDWVEKQTGEKK